MANDDLVTLSSPQGQHGKHSYRTFLSAVRIHMNTGGLNYQWEVLEPFFTGIPIDTAI